VPWLPVRARSYGFSAGSQLRGVDFTQKGGGSRFRVIEEGADQGLLELTVPGRHNALNALGAAAVARALGIEWSDIRSSLNGFQGVTRRFQFLGEENGIVVVDDYAHHPREIEAVISTARAAHPDRRLVVVFQPHLFTRTRDFASAFGSALAAADVVWVSDIYAAREEPIPGVDGELVAREVRASAAGRTKAVEVHLHGDLESLPGALAGALHPGDLCLTLGAGSIEGVGQALLDLLKNSSLRGAHV
jgi:UDP-N-acetylmuramate--alanine ligase